VVEEVKISCRKGFAISHASAMRSSCCFRDAVLQGPPRDASTLPSPPQPSRLPGESDARSFQLLSSRLELRGVCCRDPLDRASNRIRSEWLGSRANSPRPPGCLLQPARDPKLAGGRCSQCSRASNRAHIGRRRSSKHRIGLQRSPDPNLLSPLLHMEQCKCFAPCRPFPVYSAFRPSLTIAHLHAPTGTEFCTCDRLLNFESG